jgi:CMP-N-acetylneuraminic acid synthetase
MNNLAIIPARSGSKRVKNKNIIIYKNRPLLYWTIKAAKETGLFSCIHVSTDCLKIKKIAEKFGADVSFLRSASLSDDKTAVDKVTLDTILKFKKLKNKEFANVVQLMPNCPLRNSSDIQKHYNYFIKNKKKIQISCMQALGSNSWWSFYYYKKKVIKLYPDAFKKRSQDLPKLFTPSGAIWIANVNKLLKKKSFYNKETTYYPISWIGGFDIDTLDDLELLNKLNIK